LDQLLDTFGTLNGITLLGRTSTTPLFGAALDAWLAAEFGWVLAEMGRQPWAIDGVLPTFLGASSLTATQVIMTIIGFTALYSALAVVEVGLIIRTIKKGPMAHADDLVPALGSGRYATGGSAAAVPAE
jgi:cytochrome d ubiquinol oxidase subunit I